jgi:hypothetical protein
MDTPAEASPGLFDEAGVIVVDTSCRRCGYNLRGLHRDGRCPECGTAMAPAATGSPSATPAGATIPLPQRQARGR